jgi:hypothetical protein
VCISYCIFWLCLSVPRFRILCHLQIQCLFADKPERNCQRGIIFSTSYDTRKLILLSLWSDTWLVSGKPCSSWRLLMQVLPAARKWQLRSGLSVRALLCPANCAGKLASNWLKVRFPSWIYVFDLRSFFRMKFNVHNFNPSVTLVHNSAVWIQDCILT